MRFISQHNYRIILEPVPCAVNINVETSEQGWVNWVKNKIVLFGQSAELLPHPTPIICRALTHVQALKATPSTPVTISHPASYQLPVCAPKGSCPSSSNVLHFLGRICLSAHPSIKHVGALRGHGWEGISRRPICLIPEAYAYLTSERGRTRRPSDMKRNRREAGGGRATGPGNPPNCGPAANCRAAGPRSDARHALPAAMLPSSSRSRCC